MALMQRLSTGLMARASKALDTPEDLRATLECGCERGREA